MLILLLPLPRFYQGTYGRIAAPNLTYPRYKVVSKSSEGNFSHTIHLYYNESIVLRFAPVCSKPVCGNLDEAVAFVPFALAKLAYGMREKSER